MAALAAYISDVASQGVKLLSDKWQEGTMGWIVTKYLITAAIVVLVSEFAKRSDKLGALVAGLPLVTV